MDIAGGGGGGGYFANSDSSPPTSSSSSSAADSNNGLKFGKKIYFGDHVGLLNSTPPNPKPAGSSSRKVANQQQQQTTPRCQVEGCNVDLSDVKPYYSRHKVCGIHSKTPTVIVAGLEQRFCQQCSRFHLLPEFDQGKRSCRRRLAGHNERRRKPPPGSMLSSSYGRLSSTLFENSGRGNGGGGGGGGGFLLDFTSFPRSSGREANNDETHFNLWQNSSSQNPPPPNIYTQVSTGFSIHPGECYSIADSSCALSLLSNEQQWSSSRSRPSSHTAVGNLVDSEAPPVATLSTAAATTISPYQNTWGFKGGGTNAFGSSHGMLQSDLGLGQIQPHSATGSELDMSLLSRRQYMELEENSRPYGSSDQHINWSL